MVILVFVLLGGGDYLLSDVDLSGILINRDARESMIDSHRHDLIYSEYYKMLGDEIFAKMLQSYQSLSEEEREKMRLNYTSSMESLNGFRKKKIALHKKLDVVKNKEKVLVDLELLVNDIKYHESVIKSNSIYDFENYRTNYNNAITKIKSLRFEKKELLKFININGEDISLRNRISKIDIRLKEQKEIKKRNTLEFNKMYDMSNRLLNCNKYWHIDFYKKFDIKNVAEQYFCMSMFCDVCKKLLQAQRMKKYMPIMQKYDKDLYFVTLTVANVAYDDYSTALSCMEKAYFQLHQVLIGKRSVGSLVNVKELGYKGSLVSYETTYYNPDEVVMRGKELHPHIHSAFVLTGLSGKGYICPRANICHPKYSFNSKEPGRVQRLFTKHEFFIQNLWYLLYLEQWLKYELCDDDFVLDIDLSLDHVVMRKEWLTPKICKYFKFPQISYSKKKCKIEGYSCTIDKFKPGEYKEMFKYMIKDKPKVIEENGEPKEVFMSFKVFKVFQSGLYNFKQLRPYGLFYVEVRKSNVDDNVIDEDLLNEHLAQYEGFMSWLKKESSPVRVVETLQETLQVDSLYINTKKIFSYVMKFLLEDKFKNVSYIHQENDVDENTKNKLILDYIISQYEQSSTRNKTELQENYGFFSNPKYTPI